MSGSRNRQPNAVRDSAVTPETPADQPACDAGTEAAAAATLAAFTADAAESLAATAHSLARLCTALSEALQRLRRLNDSASVEAPIPPDRDEKRKSVTMTRSRPDSEHLGGVPPFIHEG